MSLIKWEGLLDPENLFEETPELEMSGWDLATDVYEQNGNLMVEIQVPGIDPDTYEISLEDGTLKVEGKREKKTEVEDQNYHRKEIHRGHFVRRVELPEGEYDESGISSTQEEGVLKISVPKK